jgi:PAS domain S-box-containing protein
LFKWVSMRSISFKGQLFLAFGAAVVLLIGVGVLSYRRILQEDADQKWVEHTHLVLERLDSVLVDLVDQETGQRGFALTRDRSFLEPHDRGRARLQEDLTELRHLTSDNPKQQRALDRLEPLVKARLAVFQEQATDDATQRSRAVVGKQFMDQIRTLLQGMREEEQGLLARRLESASAASRKMKAIIGTGAALALLLLFVAGFVVQSEIRKRTRTEQELRSTEERYHLLFDSNPIPAWVYDTQSLLILDVNAEAISHYRYSREEFLNFKITDIRPPEDIPAVVESAAKAPEAAESSGPWRHRKKSGEIIDVEIKSYPLVFAGKQARLVVALDITERNRAEKALRLSEERFRLLVSGVKDYAILMLDPEGHVASWNDGAERIKGYRAEEIIGHHFSRFYPPEDVESGKPPYELKVAAERGRFEDEDWRVRKDGSRFWANVIITALRDETGQLRGFGKVTRDMTERKKIEQTLQASEERFRNLAETANDAIISADAKGRIIYVNRATEQAFRYSDKELIGQPLTLLMPERFRNSHLEGFERFLKTGEAHVIGRTLELEGQRKDGTMFPIEISLSSWRTAEGVFFTGILSDITERKLAEEEMRLRNAQLDAANKELEAFSYSVSHDLRAPLRGIDGFSQALLEDCADKLEEAEKSHLHRIRAGTQRMGVLIDDLLNLSRVARAEMHRERVNVSALARSIAADLQKTESERRAEFRIEDGIEAMGDPHLLRIVLENLLGNAWKFTSKRTSARIEVGRTNHNGSRAYFVRDNGAGFDRAYAGKLFGAFQRLHGMTEFPGTGVGLATVQRIIHRHGGKIWAEGAVEKGASFFFTL